MTLVEFLTARLDERERWAKSPNVGHAWSYDDRTMSVRVGSDSVEWRPSDADHAATCDYEEHWECSDARKNARLEGEHITAWQPVFVLADIAAKRRIIASVNDWPYGPGDPEFADMGWRDHAELVLQLLAQPYADHPDFDPDWRL